MIAVARAALFCATMGIVGAVSAAEAAPPIRVLDAAELTLGGYTVVKRLWTETWRSAFWVPTESDWVAAIAAVTSEAASLGANAVTNLYCLNDAGGWGGGYFCYALAIKLK